MQGTLLETMILRAHPLSLTGPGIPDYMEHGPNRLESALSMSSFFIKSGLAFLIISLLTGLASPTLGGKKSMELSAADQELLFKVARDSIKAHLKGEQAVLPQTTSPVLSQPRGLFVTLNRQGRLRGCIGYLEAVIPVLAAVQEMALAAAFRDPRFPPLREEELADLEVEISILSPMRLIKDVDEIQVGRHGLFMARGPCRGLLLPQVATEYGWDRFTFLQQTCRKAGLPADAWKDPATKIYVFSADILHEPPNK
jgi:AmmeMemoRadiSam system protein A